MHPAGVPAALPQVADAPAPPPRVCVVLHDVAPARWPACLRVLLQLRALAAQTGAALPVSLLVVPRLHGDAQLPPAYLRWLRSMQRDGHELVLHGWTHRDEQPPPRGWRARLLRRAYTAGEGEFAAIDEADAHHRLRRGLGWCAELGLRVQGFVPPAWLISTAGWRALHAQPLRYACTLRHLVRLGDGARVPVPALVYSTRSAWRRQASVLWHGVLARRSRSAPLLRLELHPHDADHAPLRACWSDWLAQALREREAVTLGTAAAGLWPEAQPRVAAG